MGINLVHGLFLERVVEEIQSEFLIAGIVLAPADQKLGSAVSVEVAEGHAADPFAAALHIRNRHPFIIDLAQIVDMGFGLFHVQAVKRDRLRRLRCAHGVRGRPLVFGQ